MRKITRERVERAARLYASNKDAGAALGVTPNSFARLCRHYGIQTPGEWEIFTRDGIERRPRSRPMQVDIGMPEVVEVASAVTSTGQGKKLEKVEVVVSKGVGGTVAQGIADDQGVGKIVEDQQGNVWFATSKGLSRFDGVGWTTFTREDGLASNRFADIAVDPQGHLWATTYDEGISRFDGQRWITYKVPGLGVSLSFVRNGSVWVAAGYTLYKFDGQDWWEYNSLEGIHFRRSDGSIDLKLAPLSRPRKAKIKVDEKGV